MVCLGCLFICKIYVTNIWPSILMIVTLWLQHSYFNGSSQVFHFAHEFLTALRERDLRIRQQRIVTTDIVAVSPDSALEESKAD